MDYSSSIAGRGWYVFENLLPLPKIQALKAGLIRACQICENYQAQAGMLPQTRGTAHHILSLDPCFETFLEAGYLQAEIRDFFSGPYILNSFGGVLNSPSDQAYVQNIHRDQRSWSGDFPLMLNMLVTLDDFSSVNGGTWLLSGSHLRPEKPSESEFYASATQLIAPAGSILLFHSLLWHAGGQNQSSTERAALTLTWTRPLMKPQFDYCGQYSEAELKRRSVLFQQVIGYYARVPTRFEEWYQPPEKRFYRSDQG